mgnify:CR=1 FL=1
MDNLRHSPQDLTCNSQRTGFYSDGTWCAATLHRPATPEAETLPAILMLHGWGGIQDALTVSYYEEFTRAGYAVMTFDYRGWGDSAGLPRHVIAARQRVADADAALAFLKSQPGIDPRRIVLWGSSFGGGHAVELAAEYPGSIVTPTVERIATTSLGSVKRANWREMSVPIDPALTGGSHRTGGSRTAFLRGT